MKYRLGFNNGNSIVKSYGVSDSNRLTLCDRTVRSNASNLNVWSALLYMYLYCTLPFSCHTGVQTINECHCSLRPGHWYTKTWSHRGRGGCCKHIRDSQIIIILRLLLLLWRTFLFLLLNEVFFYQRFEIQQWPMKYQKRSTVIYRWSSGPSSTQGLFNIKRYVPYLFLYIHCWQICSNFARCMDTFNEFLLISFVKSEKKTTLNLRVGEP